jgi:hypothetical protein
MNRQGIVLRRSEAWHPASVQDLLHGKMLRLRMEGRGVGISVSAMLLLQLEE